MMADLTKLCASKDPDDLFTVCNGTCTAGFDQDGSTGREIYENGIRLGRKLGSNPRAKLFTYSNGQTAWFFVYTDEDELVTRLNTI
jgi:hypothetical protein